MAPQEALSLTNGPVHARPGRRRTLLVVSPYLPPAGGLETYAVSVAEVLERTAGWRIVLASSGSRSRSVEVDHQHGRTVYRLPVAFKWSNTPLHPAWPRQLRQLIALERPDVISAHAPVPGIAECAARAAGAVPFVLTYHWGTLAKGRFPYDQAAFVYERWVLQWMCRKAAHVIASSSFVEEIHAAAFGDKTTVITPGVNCSLYTGPMGPRPPTALFVGDLSRGAAHKGLSHLLHAFAIVSRRCPDADLLVVGDGDGRPEFEHLAVRLGLAGKVRFTGRLEGEALASVYRSTRFLVLPSHQDNFPVVLLEAMASRCAVIATRVGAVPELVKDGEHGYLVRPGDVQDLATRLERLLEQPGLASQQGEAGRCLVQRDYTWDVRAEKTGRVLEQAMIGRH